MLGLPALTLLLRSQDSLVLDIVVSLYAAVAIIAIASYFSRQGRNLKIQADTRAARLLGREELLQSLRKILQIEQEHPEMAKKKGASSYANYIFHRRFMKESIILKMFER